VRYVCPVDAPLNVGNLAARIRSSSNFRFSWQFYQFDGIDPRSSSGVRAALDMIIESPDLHQFLREAFDDMYHEKFTIEPLHEHCRIESTPEFESTLAAAAADHLGAYSPDLRSATTEECAEVAEIFHGAGDCCAYKVLPGNVAGCSTCQVFKNHLFTNWFYCVAWDWCFLTTWPSRKLLWIGCLTDTD
jgi:hypothetical protein